MILKRGYSDCPGAIYMYMTILVKLVYISDLIMSGEPLYDHWSSGS